MNISLGQSGLEQFNCDGDSSSVSIRWEKWKRALEIYFKAASIEEPCKKRAVLLHTGGLCLQEIFYNLPGANIEEDENIDVYNIAIEKLNEYFSPKHSKLYERHKFRQMKQDQNEKFEKFLIRLRNQTSKCDFKDEDQNLIDQVVEKCSSAELRKKILSQGDNTTVDWIVNEANILEAVETQIGDFSGKSNTTIDDVNKISYKKVTEDKSWEEKPCYRCGSKKHLPENCRFIKDVCHKCGYRGHLQNYCRTRPAKRKIQPNYGQKENRFKIHKKEKFEGKNNVDYIFMINNNESIDNDSVIQCDIGNVAVEMEIDSGCKHNLLTGNTWDFLKASNVVVWNQNKNPKKRFFAYASNNPLKVKGCFDTNISINNRKVTTTFYVIEDGQKNLLGKTTAQNLGVLKLGANLLASVQRLEPFPKFKNVLIEIPIDERVTPIIQPYRRIPLPLEKRVEEKLEELVSLDIIEEVNKPSKWVSPIVPILKSNNELRICVDMRCANRAILKENHPLPTIDQILLRIRKATIFSRLDIKNAFHQLEISEHSRQITTFITSKGLFQYKRLMFGICCAPEIFQKTLERILLPCEGTVNFIDDILIFGQDEEEHQNRLRFTMKILKENNILLNEEKCFFNTKEVKFLGHKLSEKGIKPLESYVKVIQKFRNPRTLEELQSFLGLVNYVNKWIPNMASLTEPLREILRQKLRKNSSIENFWKQKQQECFVSLKKKL